MLRSLKVLTAAVATMTVVPCFPVLAQHRATLQTGISVAARPAAGSLDAALGVSAPLLQQPRQRSAGARLAWQFAAASAGAVGGGLATYFMLRNVSETRVEGDEGYTRSGNVGYLVGSFAGATLGAQVVGTNLGGKAPLWATSIGALIGTVPLMALGIDEPFLPLYGLVIGWLPQGALAAGGFVMGQSR